MTKTESLLQELIDLKQTELRRARTHSILVFIFITLPALTMISLSIIATIFIISAVGEVAQNFPEIAENFAEDQKDDLFNSFIEEAKSKFDSETTESY